jgi:integrase
VPISAWLADVLRAHRTRSGGVGLVFPSQAGTPLNKANVRKRVWIPLLTRAKVRYRDLYSLRWTFVSLASANASERSAAAACHRRRTVPSALKISGTIESR